jgi:hypothetical protein
MEKEIYLTEALYSTEINDTAAPPKEKAMLSPFQSRPESAKMPGKKINNNFLPESYYDDKKVKPGISLYKVASLLFRPSYKFNSAAQIINTQALILCLQFLKLFCSMTTATR